MTESFYVNLLLGHLVGDSLLQNNWMALNKSKSSWPCFVHCQLYTLSVVLFTGIWSFWWWHLIFMSHYFIDRYSLVDKWLRFIGGCSPSKFLENNTTTLGLVEYTAAADHYIALRAGFTALVYAVADNTVHIILMLLAAKVSGYVG
jgi:hypothetical protein